MKYLTTKQLYLVESMNSKVNVRVDRYAVEERN